MDHRNADTTADDSLSDAVRSVARRLRQASLESLARWDVTPSQFRVLRALMRSDDATGLRPSELAEYLRIAPRSTTEVVDDLAAKGLIERRPDPQDRRATLVVLTERGAELGARISAASGTETERVFDRLDPVDRVELARILHQLLD